MYPTSCGPLYIGQNTVCELDNEVETTSIHATMLSSLLLLIQQKLLFD